MTMLPYNFGAYKSGKITDPVFRKNVAEKIVAGIEDLLIRAAKNQ